MTRYLLRRVPSALLVLVLASMLVFAVIRLVPGDPVATLAGPDATPEARATIRHELGLDQSVVSQYVDWVHQLFTGDLGRSYMIGGDIGDLVRQGLANTLVLTAAALLISVVLGLVLSLVTVIADKPWLDNLLAAGNTLAVALPTFVTGLLLVLVFAVVLPVLPALCLALPTTAALTRFLTDALQSQLRQPYVLTATALGISRRRIVLTQALRNALPSTVTLLGIQVGVLLGGAVLVEAIFAWPGLGRLIEQGISSRDYPVVQVLLLMSVAVFVVTQLVSDAIHAWLDPRVRLGGES